LARVLGIPVSPSEAVAVLASGREGKIDLGQADGKSFCCIASCGFDSDANRIANEASVPGAVVYFYAALKALAAWRKTSFRLRLDGVESSLEGYSVIVANSKAYGAGMFIAPDADLTDGLFDVVTISDSSRLRFLANLPKVFKGKHLDAPTVQVSRAKSVVIEADRPFTVYADGDPLCELPAEITVRPAAVSVILP
jgi:diacylglycerol kinase family enzyme